MSSQPPRPKWKVDDFKSDWEDARIDAELARRGYVREIGRLDNLTHFMDRVFEQLTGERPPEFEPEDIRIRKVS